VRYVDTSTWTGRLIKPLVPHLSFVRPQLVVLDTGMIAELSTNDKDSVLSFFKVRGCWVVRVAGVGWG
jgi:hypothetical protein